MPEQCDLNITVLSRLMLARQMARSVCPADLMNLMSRSWTTVGGPKL